MGGILELEQTDHRGAVEIASGQLNLNCPLGPMKASCAGPIVTNVWQSLSATTGGGEAKAGTCVTSKPSSPSRAEQPQAAWSTWICKYSVFVTIMQQKGTYQAMV